jgi:APA family basic amino acid/polyamine antiporter
MKKYFRPGQIAAILIANMIGTGVFTSLGFQVLDIHSGYAILLLWLIGGVVSMLGAVCYSRLTILMPRSGGEYVFLSKIYHPSLGFLSGWVSLIIGFAAPIAAASFAFGSYFNNFNPWISQHFGFSISPTTAGASVILLLTLLNVLKKIAGAKFQFVFTTIKILSILAIIFIGLSAPETGNTTFAFDHAFTSEIFTPAFAISLFFISYSYSGWNSLCYITEEIENAPKKIFKNLLLGTSFVTIIYVALNYTFLRVIPTQELSGCPDIVMKFAEHALSPSVAHLASGLICVLLLSTINSMIIIGPRVSKSIGEDFSKLNFLSKENKDESPYFGLIIQLLLALIYLFTASFEQLIIYTGFVLNIFTFLSVLGLFFIKENTERFKLKKLIAPLLFLSYSLWLLFYGVYRKPLESGIGIGVCLLGLAVYFLIRQSGTKIKA